MEASVQPSWLCNGTEQRDGAELLSPGLQRYNHVLPETETGVCPDRHHFMTSPAQSKFTLTLYVLYISVSNMTSPISGHSYRPIH